MRIITGKARGLHLNVPKNYDVRPTADRVKESLFNIIGAGARFVQFVDNSRTSLKLTDSNIVKCRAEADCKVMKCDAESAMELLYKQGQRFELVFVDPPYNKGWIQKILAKLVKCPLLADNGLSARCRRGMKSSGASSTGKPC